jgi:eukaryotic-like serine/threonine-protein kinase
MKNPLIGHQLANFRVERLIGRGGMAEVYYGHDLMLHRPVAIKVIDARLRSNSNYAQRFVQEARTIAQWRHENIVQIFFAGEEDSLFYFVMEYIEGLDLSELLAQYRADGTLIPFADALHIGGAVASALDFAHQNGVIHRDIKPSNVMVEESGRVALTDFGLALDVNQGSIGRAFGSAYYIAPEQARRSSAAVPQSDLYSLAVILYEMLTGVVPFDDPSPASLALQHLTLPPPSPRTLNPNLNQETEAVLLIALSKEAEERYPNGKSLMEALGKALALSVPKAAAQAVPTKAEVPPIQSPISVQEKVNQYFAENPPGSNWDAEAGARANRATTGTKRYSWVTFVAAGASLLVLLIFITLALSNILLPSDETAEADATPASAIAETTNAANQDGQAIEPANPGQPVESPTIQMPLPIIEVVTIIATNTPAPPTPTIDPTHTAVAVVPTLSSPMPTATVLYPDGRPIQLLYDDYSFYVLNLDDQQIEIESIAFEGLNAIGESAGYNFSGSNWAIFHDTLDSGRCNRIETRQAPFYLRPGQCPFYNATVTPVLTDELVFWSGQNNIASFRILWEDQEIGRCQVGARICDVFLP